MGVRGLKTYVDRNGLLKDFFFIPKSTNPLENESNTKTLSRTDSQQQSIASLCNQSYPPKLVVDGRSLMHFIYQQEFDCAVGGQYSAFKRKLKEFFNSLLNFELEIVGVVLDRSTGAPEFQQKRMEDMLEDTMHVACALRRFREGPYPLTETRGDYDRLPLPVLSMCVMIDTLKELSLPIYLTKKNGDQSVAALANHFHAFVVSEDTDFMIYELHLGYIPLSSLLIQQGTCKVFQIQELCKHMNLPPSMLKLFAAALGSRHFPLDEFKYLYHRMNFKNFHIFIPQILTILSSYQHLPLSKALTQFLLHFHAGTNPRGPSYEEWEKRFKVVIEIYSMDVDVSQIETDPIFDPYGYSRMIPEYQMFRCDPLLEDLNQPSAWHLSRDLRKIGYSRFSEVPILHEIVRTQQGEIEQCMVRVPKLTSDPSFLMEGFIEPYGGDALVFAIKYVMEYGMVSLTQLLALALATVIGSPAILREHDLLELTFHIEMIHVLACLETTMISWSMATHRSFRRVLDALPVHYFYSQLSNLSPKIVMHAIETFSETNQEDQVLDFLKLILGDDLDTSELKEDKENFWLLDWN